MPGAVLGVLPGGRGNDFARMAGIPLDAGAACDVLAHGARARRSTWATAGGAHLPRHRLARASTPTPTGSPTPRPPQLGRLVYLYGALRALVGVEAARASTSRSTASARRSRAGASPRRTRALRWRHAPRPRRRARRRRARRRLIGARSPRRTSCARLPKVFKGAHVHEPMRPRSCAAPRCASSADRPFTVYADGDPIGDLPITIRARAPARCRCCCPHDRLLERKVAAARAGGRLSRRAGRGGTSLPGKVLMRLEPHAIGRLASRLANGSAVISATNGKTTTAAMVAAILERGGDAARAQPRRGEHGRRRGERAAAGGAPRERLPATPASSRSTSSGSARSSTSCGRARCCSRNLFRDQLDRYGELDTIADRWAGVVARTTAAPRPQRRRPDRRRPRPRAAAATRGTERVFFGVEDDAVALREMQHAADAKHCRRCGAPYRYDAVYLGPPRPLPLRQLRRARARSRRSPPPTSCSRASAARGSRCARPAGERADRRSRSPASTTSTTRSRPPRWRSRWAPRSTTSPRACSAVSPAFGRAETVRLGDRDLSILLVKNPAGANEVLRTLALEPGEHDLLAILNDQVADGRDVSWVWDADFEVLADARAARDLQRDARGGDGAAAEVRGRADGADRGRDRPRRGPRPRRSGTATGGCSRCRPTPRCSGCATCSSPAAPRGAASRERRPAAGRARARGHLARRRVRRLRRGPAAVARPRDQPRRAGARRRRRDRPRVARTSPARATASSRSTARPDLLAALRARSAGLPDRDRRGRRARLRPRRAAVRR